MPFNLLALSPLLVRALKDEGYETPTPIQVRAIPPALEGKDIIGCAQTGTGKTAAFALPILHRLLDSKAGEMTGGGSEVQCVTVSSPFADGIVDRDAGPGRPYQHEIGDRAQFRIRSDGSDDLRADAPRVA